MKLPKKKQSKGTLKRSDSKRHKAIFESDSTNSSRYTRRCMSTELLQLLCLQRSFLNIAEHSQHSPRRKANFSKEKSLSPQRFVNISTWSLSTKETVKESSDYFEKDKSDFQDFVNLYSKVKDFQSRNHGNEPDYATHKSLSLPSIDTLPSFAHLLSELTSYFNEDIEQFYDDDSTELSRDDTATGFLKSNCKKTNRCFREELSDYSSQDSKFNPNIPNFVVKSNIYKKSSLDDFLSRISRTAPKVCDKCFIFSDSTDLASRLQASSTKMCDHVDKKPCRRIPRNKKKVLKLKEKSGGNTLPRRNARVRSSKSDSDNNQANNTETARCCDHEDKTMTLQKSTKNNKCEQKKLLEMFQLLFKKHKAREHLNVISKLPPRRGSLNLNRTKSKIGGRSCERTLERKHNLPNSQSQSADSSKTPLPRKDSLPFHARNMDKSSSTPKSIKSVKVDTSPPKKLGERPVPFPRKPKIHANTDSEQTSTDTSSKDNDYSVTISDMDSSKNKYVVRNRVKDSSSTPSFKMEKEKKKQCINLRDGSISNSISSPDSSCCSPKDDVDLSLVRLRHKLSLYDKDVVLDDQLCDRFNVENYGNQRFWTGILKTLLTPVKQTKEVTFKSSKTTVIPGPFSASLTNLLKQNLPDVSLQYDFHHYSSFACSSHHLPLSYSTSLPSCLDSSTISSSIVHDKVSLDDCFNKFSEREDSVMGNQSFSSLLTLQENPNCKYFPTGATSSDLVLDQCWPGGPLTLSDSSMKLTPLKIFSKTAIQEAISDVENTQETLISNTILRDKIFFHASEAGADNHRTENNNKVSVCVQTDSLNKCSASTSFSNLTKRTESNDSTMMIVKQLTKLHKLVSVPLSNAPLISQISRIHKSPEVSPKSRSKSRASKVSHRTTMKKVVKRRTPSPLFNLKTRSQQENICIEKPENEAFTKSEPIHIQTFTDDSSDCIKGITLFSDKLSTSSKQRKIRSKKTVDKINCEKVKYFENRNRNVSYRNANMNQNFGCDDFKNSNCNSNIKNKMVGEESSSTDDDSRDKTVVPVIVNSLPEEQSFLNVNDKFSRFMNQGRYVEALETTFEKGFSVDREDPWSGERALVCAVVKSQQEIISRLLDLGAILDAPDYNGRTAFLASAIQVDHVAAWILLSHGLEVFCAAPLKVAHGRSKNIAQFAKFLELTLLCGYNPGKELKWFETVLKSNSPNNANEQQLIIATQNLLSSCRQPSTLSMLCFTSIRRHLSKINMGRSITSSISRLPLPNLLKRFLYMDGVV